MCAKPTVAEPPTRPNNTPASMLAACHANANAHAYKLPALTFLLNQSHSLELASQDFHCLP